MINLTSAFAYQNIAVHPDELMPIAELMLRWAWNTDDKIKSQLYSPLKGEEFQKKLTLYELKDVLFQQNERSLKEYNGAILTLQAIIVPRNCSYDEYIGKFTDIFVCRQDVVNIEEKFGHRDYCALPPGIASKMMGREDVCTTKNIHVMGPAVFRKIFSSKHWQNASDETQTVTLLPKTHVWPWLGPINPPLSHEVIRRTVRDDQEEISDFVKAAKELGQRNPYCLAKMVKHRYPEISYPLLVDVIDPDHSRNPKAARQMGRRWLTEDAECHAEAVC
ncbi:hypothetical protein [Desulfovibrio falkowii]|uniref:Uncharacterized protein n=1 Tax=Desulfovibrio falkowii TaxID=3136602 RepID=A0ABQ0E7E8_9BACT